MAVTIDTTPKRIYSKGGVTCYLEFPKALENELEASFGINSDFQRFWDNMLLTDMNNYVPFLTGVLRQSAIINTVIGSGELIWQTPYARYIYHGKLMVDPITGKGAFYSEGFGFWSRPGVSKVLDPAGRELEFHGGGGAEWDVRAANDKMPEWINNMQTWLTGRR